MNLGKRACGRWQSTHLATAWWLPLTHESYSELMMWQLAQDLGSVPK
jgi:hypothetical protein